MKLDTNRLIHKLFVGAFTQEICYSKFGENPVNLGGTIVSWKTSLVGVQLFVRRVINVNTPAIYSNNTTGD